MLEAALQQPFKVCAFFHFSFFTYMSGRQTVNERDHGGRKKRGSQRSEEGNEKTEKRRGERGSYENLKRKREKRRGRRL